LEKQKRDRNRKHRRCEKRRSFSSSLTLACGNERGGGVAGVSSTEEPQPMIDSIVRAFVFATIFKTDSEARV
jgi:hypothetical protein